jgi:hypothetical protein
MLYDSAVDSEGVYVLDLDNDCEGVRVSEYEVVETGVCDPERDNVGLYDSETDDSRLYDPERDNVGLYDSETDEVGICVSV